MATEWAVRRVSINDENASDKLTAFAAEGWTVHSTSSYWDSSQSPDDSPTLVVVAYRDGADSNVKMAVFPTQERWTHDEPSPSGETFEQRFERWSDEIDSWNQAVLVAV